MGDSPKSRVAKTINPKVKKIAKKVRLQCEEYAMSEESAVFYENEDLSMMCDIASLALKKAMAKEGFRARVFEGDYNKVGHCWVGWREFIIDITATQFNYELSINLPPVYITSMDNKNYGKGLEIYVRSKWRLSEIDKVNDILSLKGKGVEDARY